MAPLQLNPNLNLILIFKDRFTLPNGYTGPILTVGGPSEITRVGLLDPLTNMPYLYEVILG